MRKLAILIVVIVVISVGYMLWPRPPHEIIAYSQYPNGVHFVPPDQCIGRYDNGVSVSWRSINGTC